MDYFLNHLKQCREEVDNWPFWMKDQEPSPGQTYEDWVSEKRKKKESEAASKDGTDG